MLTNESRRRPGIIPATTRRTKRARDKNLDRLLERIARRERNWPTQGIRIQGGVIRYMDGWYYEEGNDD